MFKISNDFSSGASGPVLLRFYLAHKPWTLIFAQIMGTGDLPKLLKWWSYVDVWPFFTARSNLLPHAFVWAIYIYIGSIEVTCRSTVAKIILTGNLRWPPSCLCLLYFSATVLFTCMREMREYLFINYIINLINLVFVLKFEQIYFAICWCI